MNAQERNRVMAAVVAIEGAVRGGPVERFVREQTAQVRSVLNGDLALVPATETEGGKR